MNIYFVSAERTLFERFLPFIFSYTCSDGSENPEWSLRGLKGVGKFSLPNNEIFKIKLLPSKGFRLESK